jgi:hypothetical protein
MSHVVPDLVQKIHKGQDPLHLLGDGTQVRHYTYGADLARGIVSAMEHPDATNDDFNLSPPARRRCSSSRSNLEAHPTREALPHRSDPRRARRPDARRTSRRRCSAPTGDDVARDDLDEVIRGSASRSPPAGSAALRADPVRLHLVGDPRGRGRARRSRGPFGSSTAKVAARGPPRGRGTRSRAGRPPSTGTHSTVKRDARSRSGCGGFEPSLSLRVRQTIERGSVPGRTSGTRSLPGSRDAGCVAFTRSGTVPEEKGPQSSGRVRLVGTSAERRQAVAVETPRAGDGAARVGYSASPALCTMSGIEEAGRASASMLEITPPFFSAARRPPRCSDEAARSAREGRGA